MVSSHLVPLVIAGPTASGKSKLALRLAKKFRGEIICADSRQFYQGLEIGTASPNKQEQNNIIHHGYNIFDPAKIKLDAAYFVSWVKQIIKNIQDKNKRPILVGGTGLYLRALRYNLDTVPKSDPQVIKKIVLEKEKLGLNYLYEKLVKLDLECAKKIAPTDQYRIIRNLEIFYQTNKKPSDLKKNFLGNPNFMAHWVYIKPDKQKLLVYLQNRIAKFFELGLVQEALSLREKLGADHWVMSIMGYYEALLYADNKITQAQAQEKIFIRHRQYAKRQYTWFNKEKFYKII